MTRIVHVSQLTDNQDRLIYLKYTLQCRSNCCGVSDNLNLVSELKSVSFGDRYV